MPFDKCPCCGYHEAITAQLNAHVMNKFVNQFGGVATFNKPDDVTSFTTVDPKTNSTITWTKVGDANNSNIVALKQPVAEPAEGTEPVKTANVPIKPAKEVVFEADDSLIAPPLADKPIAPLKQESPVVTQFGGPPASPQPKFVLKPQGT